MIIEAPLRYPITGIAPCSARAASGHAAPAPPSSVMNSRRFTAWRHFNPAFSGFPSFPHDLARIIHDADARFLDRHIESNKIGHAALLLLMLEAVFTDLVSPSA